MDWGACPDRERLPHESTDAEPAQQLAHSPRCGASAPAGRPGPGRRANTENFRPLIYNIKKEIMKNRQSRKAFTLVELLIVISIIAVLAGLVMPALTGAMGSANKLKSLNQAKGIATAWQSYAKGERSRSINTDSIHEWAFRLAEHADLNMPAFWILDFDPIVSDKLGTGATMPVNIGDKIGSKWKISEEFKAFPLSWEVANAVPANAPSYTPLLWTRGLKPTGLWDKNEGVFADQGGHIAFVDMSVKWFDALRDEEVNPRGELKRYNETMPTFDISQAIRGGSKNILKSQLE